MKNDRVHFVWTQFSELNCYFKKQVEDETKLNGKLAELISLVTCDKKSTSKKGFKSRVSSELKEILTRMDTRVRSLYSMLPANAMLIICTGHGDTAVIHRYIASCLLFYHELLHHASKLVFALNQN